MEKELFQKLKNGLSIEDIGILVQKYTNMCLYLDPHMNLKLVNNIEDIPYKNCSLVNTNSGYLLYSDPTESLFNVFREDVLNHLLQTETSSFDSRTHSESSLSSEFLESTEEDTREEIEIEKDTEKEKIEKEEEIEMQKDENKTVFRIFMREKEDVERINMVCLNPKIFEKVEEENNIDLEDTIISSFKIFLEKKGYPADISLTFYENTFAEISIITQEELFEEVVKYIEDKAVLKLRDDLIFFQCRTITESEESEPEEEETKKEEEEKNIDDNLYSTNVPITRLPSDLINMCLDIARTIKVDDIDYFYYNNAEIIIRNEGDGLFSVFDLDSYFYLSRLHPDKYINTLEYNELPIAQFYL